MVMLCVRVEPSLRRRVKLAAVARGRTIQVLAVEALENACRQANM
jgi:predicted HicB family RNase H-like nuclease